LYVSGLGIREEQLIFERKTNTKRETTIRFFDGFENEAENRVLKKVIEKNLCKPDRPVLKLLPTLNNPVLAKVLLAYNWFAHTLQIIMPHTNRIQSQSLLPLFHIFMITLKS